LRWNDEEFAIDAEKPMQKVNSIFKFAGVRAGKRRKKPFFCLPMLECGALPIENYSSVTIYG